MTITWRAPETPADAIVITTIDAHAAGEPLRIITGGLPELPGATILERRRYLREHLDHVRRALMWEPRGHADMYGCVVTPPVSPEADVGVVFLHNAGYSTMCGHGVIALVTALVETGTLPARGPETPVGLDTPAGLVRATAHLDAQDHVDAGDLPQRAVIRPRARCDGRRTQRRARRGGCRRSAARSTRWRRPPRLVCAWRRSRPRRSFTPARPSRRA